MVEQEKQSISVKLNGKEHSFHQIEKSSENKAVPEVEVPSKPQSHIAPLEQTIPPTPKKEWGANNDEEKKQDIAVEASEKIDETQSYFTNNIIDFNQMREEKETKEQPFWDDGNRKWIPKLPPSKRKKKTAERIKNTLADLPISLIVAGISAIIVGVGFGFMVLTAFTGDNDGTTASLMPPTGEVEAIAANGQAAGVEVTLPDLSVEIVQGGAFSTSEKGNEIVSAIKDRGQAAVLKTDGDPMYMFIGLGLQKEEAGRLTQIYQQHGQDTYVKPFAVNGSLQSIDNEAVAEFFTQGGSMFNDLVRFSVAGLSGQSVAMENIDQFLGQYQKWNDQGATVIAQLPESAQPHAQQFITSMSGAAAEIAGYKGEQTDGKLWGIQQHLLEALLAYDALIHTLN